MRDTVSVWPRGFSRLFLSSLDIALPADFGKRTGRTQAPCNSSPSRDVLTGLAARGDFPLPESITSRTNKRGRDVEDDGGAGTSNFFDRGLDTADPSHWTSQSFSLVGAQATNEQQNMGYTFALPTRSNDLGRLPLHGDIIFSDPSYPQLFDEAQIVSNYPNYLVGNPPDDTSSMGLPSSAYMVDNSLGLEQMMDPQLYDQMAKIFASSYVTPAGMGFDFSLSSEPLQPSQPLADATEQYQ